MDRNAAISIAKTPPRVANRYSLGVTLNRQTAIPDSIYVHSPHRSIPPRTGSR